MDKVSVTLKRRNLPPKWRYAVSPRAIKRVAEQLAADIRVIEFCGTRKPVRLREETVLFVGEMNARVHRGEWCFRLRFWGVPENFLNDAEEVIQHAILDDLQLVTERTLQGPTDSSIEPFDRSFRYRARGDALRADFESSTRGSLGESIDQIREWWQAKAT